MKIFYYLVLLYFALFFTSTILPQIAEITRLPVQNPEQSMKESAPIWISENEILIFYCTKNTGKINNYTYNKVDTLYYVKSTDGGLSWAPKIFVIELGTIIVENGQWFPAALKTSSGRIILAWSDRRTSSITFIYSDDNGLTWADKSLIPSPSKSYIALSELDDGRLIVSYVSSSNKVASYKESFDDGLSWSQYAQIFYIGYKTIRSLSFVSIPGKLMAFYEYDDSGIYYKMSYNYGISWSIETPVVDFEAREHNPKVLKVTDEEFWMVYLSEDTTANLDKQNDIYYIKSFDSGESWGEPQRFTRYVGEDYFLNATMLNNTSLVTFSSTRFTNKPQISYAVLGETMESFRPPYIKNTLAQSDSIGKKKWLVSCKIIDDEEVVSANVEFEDGSNVVLFDDGKHNDGDSADCIYANTIKFKQFLPSTTGYMDVNDVKLPFNNVGTLADVYLTYQQNFDFLAIDNDNDRTNYNTQLEISYYNYATYDEGVFLFTGGYGLSGYSNGKLWANAQMTSSLIVNYVPGRVGDQPEDPRNVIYTVRADEPAFGLSWQRWKDAVALGADFYDGDEDGIYNPVDKNWNGIWDTNEDMPDLLADETAWYVYNDGQPGNERIRFAGVEPQGIEIQQTIFASSLPELEDIIFIRYKITNKGTVAEVLDSVIFGFMADPDIGDHFDDLIACDTLLSSRVCYNNGEDEVYGINPPAFYTTLLQGPIVESKNPSNIAYDRKGILIGTNEYAGYKNQDITSFVTFWASPIRIDPNDEYEMRYYMKGLIRHATRLNPCNDPWGEVRGGVDCSKVNPLYWYSGDPVEDIGWINVLATDQRDMLSVGEFTLKKDKPVTIIGAYVLGRGTDALNSITVARENVRRAILEYESNFASLTYNPGEPTNPVTDYKLYHNYPNPFNPTTTIRYELPQDGIVTIKLYDILGQEVTTILKEFKKADRYEVKFDADGLASGVYIYRMKVNDFITSKKMLLLR